MLILDLILFGLIAFIFFHLKEINTNLSKERLKNRFADGLLTGMNKYHGLRFNSLSTLLENKSQADYAEFVRTTLSLSNSEENQIYFYACLAHGIEGSFGAEWRHLFEKSNRGFDAVNVCGGEIRKLLLIVVLLILHKNENTKAQVGPMLNSGAIMVKDEVQKAINNPRFKKLMDAPYHLNDY